MLGPDARLALSGTRFADVRELAGVVSTNREVAALAGRGAPEGVVVVADHQTAGRGRRGRSWEAPAGSSLLVSVLFRPPPAAVHAPAMATGLAAVAACAEVAGVGAALKWPNDVVVGEGKLGGVLAERLGGDASPAVVVGLGLNVAWDTALPPAAVDLRGLCGAVVDRGALLVAFLRALDARYGKPPGDLAAEYRARCATLGRRVRVELAGEIVTGEAIAVDEDGRLTLATAAGTRTVTVGDVGHLR